MSVQSLVNIKTEGGISSKLSLEKEMLKNQCAPTQSAELYTYSVLSVSAIQTVVHSPVLVHVLLAHGAAPPRFLLFKFFQAVPEACH